MSLFTGPGRNSEMSAMMSSKLSRPDLPTSSRWPGDSIWKTPRVLAAEIIRKVSSSSNGTCARSSRSMSWPVVSRISSTAWAIEDCMRMPSTSSLSRPSSSTSSLSNWLIGNPAKLASTGVRSSSVVSDSSTPHGCTAMWRGSPSSRSTSPNIRSSRSASMPLARSSGSSRSATRASRARMCGNALAIVSISSGGMPSAAPTSRTACRTR